MRIFLDEMDELLKQREELQKQLDAKLEAAEEEGDDDGGDEEEDEKESSDEEDEEGEEEEELERDKKVAKEPEVTRKVQDKTPPTGT